MEKSDAVKALGGVAFGVLVAVGAMPAVNARVPLPQAILLSLGAACFIAALAWPAAPAPEPPPASVASTNVAAQRGALLQQLASLYILDHDGITPAMMAGLEYPSVDWLNQQLQQRGEHWRISAISGTTVSTYDLP